MTIPTIDENSPLGRLAGGKRSPLLPPVQPPITPESDFGKWLASEDARQAQAKLPPTVTDKPWTDDAKEVGKALLKGLAIDLPRATGQALKWVSEPGRSAYETGQAIEGSANALEKDYPLDMEGRGWLARPMIEAAEQIPQSLAPVGAAAALLAASPVAVPGAAMLAVPALAGGAFAAAQQGQEDLDAAKRAGLPDGEALALARQNAVVEGVGETLGDVAVGGLFGAGRKVFGRAAQTPAEAALQSATDSSVVKPFVRAAAVDAATQPATEFGQDYLEAANRQAAGLTDAETPMRQGLHGAQVAGAQSLLLAPFGLAGHMSAGRRNAAIAQAFQDPQTPPELRTKAANLLSAEVHREDPGAAQMLAQNAAHAISNSLSLPLDGRLFDTDLFGNASADEQPQQPAGPLSRVAEAVQQPGASLLPEPDLTAIEAMSKSQAVKAARKQQQNAGEPPVIVPHPFEGGKYAVVPHGLAVSQGWITPNAEASAEKATEGAGGQVFDASQIPADEYGPALDAVGGWWNQKANAQDGAAHGKALAKVGIDASRIPASEHILGSHFSLLPEAYQRALAVAWWQKNRKEDQHADNAASLPSLNVYGPSLEEGNGAAATKGGNPLLAPASQQPSALPQPAEPSAPLVDGGAAVADTARPSAAKPGGLQPTTQAGQSGNQAPPASPPGTSIAPAPRGEKPDAAKIVRNHLLPPAAAPAQVPAAAAGPVGGRGAFGSPSYLDIPDAGKTVANRMKPGLPVAEAIDAAAGVGRGAGIRREDLREVGAWEKPEAKDSRAAASKATPVAAVPATERDAIATRYAEAVAKQVKVPNKPPDKFHYKFADAVLKRDAYGLKYLSNGLNDAGKRVFFQVTGVKLPQGQADTWKALRDWGGVSDAMDAAQQAARKLGVEERYLDGKVGHDTLEQVRSAINSGYDRLVKGGKTGNETWLINDKEQGYNLSQKGSGMSIMVPWIKASLAWRKAHANLEAEESQSKQPIQEETQPREDKAKHEEERPEAQPAEGGGVPAPAARTTPAAPAKARTKRNADAGAAQGPVAQETPKPTISGIEDYVIGKLLEAVRQTAGTASGIALVNLRQTAASDSAIDDILRASPWVARRKENPNDYKTYIRNHGFISRERIRAAVGGEIDRLARPPSAPPAKAAPPETSRGPDETQRSPGNEAGDEEGVPTQSVGTSATAKAADLEMAALQAELDEALKKVGEAFINLNPFVMKAVEVDAKKMLPALVNVMDIAFRMGHHKFKANARFVLAQIRKMFGDEAADALTLQRVQSAYNFMADGLDLADDAETVAAVKSLGELLGDEAKTEAGAAGDRSRLWVVPPAPDADTGKIDSPVYAVMGWDGPAGHRAIAHFELNDRGQPVRLGLYGRDYNRERVDAAIQDYLGGRQSRSPGAAQRSPGNEAEGSRLVTVSKAGEGAHAIVIDPSRGSGGKPAGEAKTQETGNGKRNDSAQRGGSGEVGAVDQPAGEGIPGDAGGRRRDNLRQAEPEADGGGVAAQPPADGQGAGGESHRPAAKAGLRTGKQDVRPGGGEPQGGDSVAGQPGASGDGLAAGGTGELSAPESRGRRKKGRGKDKPETPQQAAAHALVDGGDQTRPSNFHLEDPDSLIGGTPKRRFARNREAIETYLRIQEENRQPTPEEQAALAAYIGWGSFGQELFQGSWDKPVYRDGWKDENDWLREHLGAEEWKSAQASIINAHYTDPPTVQALWGMARRLGFQGGRVLEPSMGIGNFFAVMPRDLMEKSELTGIEMDKLTGGMAKLLYPDANIQVKPYQDSKTADGFYDLVIGNWPFAAEGPADRRYTRLSPSLHDYFFLKALDQVRPGGLVIGITSAGTMDKKGRATRMALAQKGELVAAYRLPTGAFEQYAGTKVVTDVLVFRKRDAEASGPMVVASEDWLNAEPLLGAGGQPLRRADGSEVPVNEYWRAHPDYVLGRMTVGRGTTQGRDGMIVERQDDFPAQLAALPSRLPENIMPPRQKSTNVRYVANNTADRQNSVVVGEDGGLYVVRGDQLAALEDVYKIAVKDEKKTAARNDQIVRLVGLRKAYGALIDAERHGSADAEDLRGRLRGQYQAFRAQHGPVNESFGLGVLRKVDDPLWPALAGLENTVHENGEAPRYEPAAILSRPTVRAVKRPENPGIRDAFVMVRNESAGAVDMERVAELANRPVTDVIADLEGAGAVFRTPAGNYEVRDVYLSGNVRRKLREALDAQENGLDMARNIEALKAVVPKAIPYFAIEAKLGAPWVSAPHYRQFFADLLGVAGGEVSELEVRQSPKGWKVRFPAWANAKPEATTVHGTGSYKFDNLAQAAMNNQSVTVRFRDEDGNLVVDEGATKQANEQANKLRESFGNWIWKSAERRIELEDAYNETMNAIAEPDFDGAFMTFEGMALQRGESEFSLRKHQVDAIYRGVVNGRGLYAHEVGTGKTLTMGGIAVESRRLGLAKKPLLFAHNANSASVAREIQGMYPGAKILYIDNLAPALIKRRMYQIAHDDWDLVVVPHSLMPRFGLTAETLDAMTRDEIAALEDEAFDAAAEDNAALTRSMMDDEEAMKKVRSVTAKQLVKMRNTILKKNAEMAGRAMREDNIPFEQLGVDMLLVDEAHEFKKPPIVTRMRVKGLNTATSGESLSLHLLSSHIRSINGGRGVHVFTGTPITNTLNEIYNQMRYVMADDMEAAGVKDWDSWFNTFADSNSDVELTPTGEYESVTRLSAFVNVAELRRMAGQYMHIVFADEMPEFKPRTTASGKTNFDPGLSEAERDELLNGRTEKPFGRPYKKVVNDSAPMGERQREVLQELAGLARQFKNATKKERRELMLSGHPSTPIMVEGNAAKAGFDIRRIDVNAPDEPQNKVNRAVANVMRHYREHPQAAQVVFMETGYTDFTERRGERVPAFNVAKDIVGKLVAQGIPREQIAIVTGATSKEQRKAIADAMNKAEIRVVIGSTATLGVGVNMQENLRAMHHLDAPWMPGELEQRNGRGHRQGNKWNTVLEYRYLTEGLDGRRWQVLAIKQKFVAAFLKADADTRVIEGDAVSLDEDGSGNDLAESLSAAAGDPRILLREKLKVDVQKLESRRRLHDHGQADARRRMEDLKNRNQSLRGRLKSGKQDVALWEEEKQKPFAITLRGTQFTDRKIASEGLANLVKRAQQDGKGDVIGVFRGFKLAVQLRHLGEPGVRIMGGLDIEAGASIASIEATLRNLLRRVEAMAEDITENERSIAALAEAARTPFGQAAALEKKRALLQQISADIEGNPAPPPAWLREGAPVGTDVFLPGDEPQKVAVEGHRWASDNWYVLVDDGGEQPRAVPYTAVRDENNMPVFESRPFVPPLAGAGQGAPAANGPTGAYQSTPNGIQVRGWAETEDGRVMPVLRIMPPETPADASRAAKWRVELSTMDGNTTVEFADTLRPATAPSEATLAEADYERAKKELGELGNGELDFEKTPALAHVGQALRKDFQELADFTDALVARLGAAARNIAEALFHFTGKLLVAIAALHIAMPGRISDAEAAAAFREQRAWTLPASKINALAVAASGKEADEAMVADAAQPSAPAPSAKPPTPSVPQGTRQPLAALAEAVARAKAEGGNWKAALVVDDDPAYVGKAAEVRAAGPKTAMDHAWAMYGAQEGGNAQIQGVLDYFGSKLSQDQYPWCAPFVSYTHARAGVPLHVQSARAMLRVGKPVPLAQAKPGDVVVMRSTNPKNGGWDGRGGHVGYLVKAEGDGVWVLGGNQRDAVNVSVFHQDRVLGVRRVEGARFSREAGKPADHKNTPQGVRAELAAAFGEATVRKLEKRGALRILDSWEPLKQVGDSALPSDKAVFDGRTAWIVAPNIAPGMAVGILLHETGVHQGLMGWLGDRWPSLVADFQRLVAAGDKAAVLAEERVGQLLKRGLMLPEHADEERIAYLVEYVARMRPQERQSLPARVRAFVTRVLRALRAALYASPFGEFARRHSLEFTAQDFAALARAAVMREAGLIGNAADMGREVHHSNLQARGEAGRFVDRAAMDRDYLEAVERGDMAAAQRMVIAAAEASGVPVFDEGGVTAYRVRRNAPPKRTALAYKLFRVKKAKPGEVFALFVGADDPLPQGVWLDAIPGPQAPNSKTGKAKVKSKLGDLAYRPGWHAGDAPLATHIGAKNQEGAVFARKDDEVWAEVEMADGSFSVALADIKEMPVDGMYRYKTNPNMTGQWIISGSMKIRRILSEDEVNRILEEKSFQTMPWARQPKGGKAWEVSRLDLNKWGLGTNPARNQKKLLDPVTYDDAGNVIPLSERFNRDVADARYSRAELNPLDPNAAPEFEQRLRDITFAEAAKMPVTWLKGMRSLGLQALGRRQLVEVYSDDLPALRSYDRLMATYGADSSKTSQQASGLVNEWGGLARRDADRLADVMHYATAYDADASAERYLPKWTPESAANDFDEEFANLNAEERRLAALILGSGGVSRKGADWWGDLEEVRKRLSRLRRPWAKKAHIKRKLAEEKARYAAWRRLHGEFRTLSPQAADIYRRAKAMYQEHWKAVEVALVERVERSGATEADKRRIIDRLRLAFRKQVPGVYFPLHRAGEYIITVKSAPDADGVIKNEAVVFAETLGQAEKLRAELLRRHKGSGAEVMPITKKRARTAQEAVSSRFVGEVLNLVGAAGGGTKADALREQVMQLYLETLPDLSWAKHEIHRKKTPGYSRDARRAFAAHMVHGAAHLARLRYADRLESALDAMQEQVDERKHDENFDAVRAQEVTNEMRKRHEITMNPPNTPMANLLTSAGFVWFMGLSPASALINLTQTPMVAWPVLGARYGMRSAAKALGVASKDTAKALAGGGWFKDEKAILARLQKQLRPGEFEAIRRGIEEGHVSVTLAHDLAGVAQGAETNPAIGNTMRAASWMFHQAEMFNRIATVLAAYRMGVGKGLPEASAYEAAIELNYKAHFDYAAANRPRIMAGPVARVLLLFKQYAQNMLYLITRNAVEGLAAADDWLAGRQPNEKRREAAKLVAGLLVSHGVAAGALGLPFATTLLALATAMGADDDEPWDAEVALRDFLSDVFGPRVAEAIVHGAPRLGRDVMPADLSSRVGLDHLLLPDVREGLEGDKWYQAAATAALGPVVGIGLNLAKGAETIAGGQVGRGVEEMLPKVLRDAVKAGRYASEGVKDRTGIQILDDTSLAEEIAQAAGFAPARVMEAYEARGAVYALDRRLMRRRSELLARWSRARLEGESGADEMADIKAFNQSHQGEPGLLIGAKSLATSLRNRKARIAEARLGIYLPAARNGEREAARFFAGD